ncbi:MAG TPA: carboxypeptidase-like regulatory domain-containing protein, partial [Candidatus Binataceae bacterium]|nr:carboxypeptidase-like regulatory domain-containing protein [Candidatus Binataceae bacterium]
MLKKAATKLLIATSAFALSATWVLGQDPQSPTQPAALEQTSVAGGEISGAVRAGNTPLPGVSISATNTLTGQKVLTSTDLDGSFKLTVPANGRYVVRAELAAFAPATKEVLINAANRSATVPIDMQLRSRAEAAAAAQQTNQGQAMAPSLGGGPGRNAGAAVQGRGFQNVGLNTAEGAEMAGSVGGENSAAGAPSDPAAQGIQMGAAGEAGEDAVSIAGNMGRGQNLGFDDRTLDDIRDRIQSGEIPTDGTPVQLGNGRQIAIMGGGPGGPGGFVGPGGPGGGNGFFGGGGRMSFNRFNVNKPHGSIFYQLGDSAFNARDYALNGIPAVKPGYEQNNYGVSLGGLFQIPKLVKPSRNTFFFFNWTGRHGFNSYDQVSTVPTLAERGGDLSALASVIMDPATGQPFSNGQVPVSPIAQQLLTYIPQPNQPGTIQNFRLVSTAYTGSDAINFRLNHNFGQQQRQQRGQAQRGGAGGRRGGRNSLSIAFNYSRSNGDQLNPFPSVHGTTSTTGWNIPIQLSHSFGRLNNTVRMQFNRSVTQTANLYAGVTNVEGQLGITGVSQDPIDWGLPTLSFTNFAGLNDISPVLNRNQTWTFGDSAIWSKGKHAMRFGGDFRRVEVNPR